MDADWSVEIGEGLPWIDVPWEGWVDLRDRASAAEHLASLPEVAAYPELAEVLLEINTRHSSAVSSKCDVFPVDIGSAELGLLDQPAATLDRDETREDREQQVRCGLGSYIDLAFTVDEHYSNFSWCEALVRRVASELLAPIPMPRASVELVIRQGSFFSVPGYGLTLYAIGFGHDQSAARESWAKVMRFASYITMYDVTSRVSSRQKQDHRKA